MKTRLLKQIALACMVVLFTTSGQLQAGVITNGSFETGDFTGWQTDEGNLIPGGQIEVVPDNNFLFGNQATDGMFSARHQFDGDGPGTLRIFQDIGVVDPLTNSLTFDYRLGWDLFNFGGSTEDRVLTLNVYQAGSFGTLLGSNNVFTIPAQTENPDTGNLLGAVDLSSFNGQAVRISFDAFVPEQFTGPAFFQLDNVQLSAGSVVDPGAVPEPGTLAIFGTICLVACGRRRLS